MNPMHLAFPGSPLKAREVALLSVLCHSSNNKNSEIHPEGTGRCGEEGRPLGQMGLSEVLVLSTVHSLAEGSLLPIQFWGSPLLYPSKNISWSLLFKNCKGE